MTMVETSDQPFRQVMAAGKLWHVHLAESNRLKPGNGLVDFPAILALKETATPHLTIKFAKPDPDTAARQVSDIRGDARPQPSDHNREQSLPPATIHRQLSDEICGREPDCQQRAGVETPCP
jgi:hypothetical protein